VSVIMNPNRERWTREPSCQSFIGTIRDTWRARRLIVFFGHQALLKSTRRTVLGWLWLPLRGVVPTVLGTFLFSQVLGVKIDIAPYPLFLLSGLIPWVLFAGTVSWSVRSLEISKRYLRSAAFPRLVLPLGYSAPALLDLCMYCLCYLLLQIWYLSHGYINWHISWAMVLSLALAYLTGLGWGMLLCIPGAQARDVRFTLSFVLGGIWAITPIAYSSEQIPLKWRWLVEANPLACIVNGFRAGLFGGNETTFFAWTNAVSIAIVSFVVGLWVFIRHQHRLT